MKFKNANNEWVEIDPIKGSSTVYSDEIEFPQTHSIQEINYWRLKAEKLDEELLLEHRKARALESIAAHLAQVVIQQSEWR